MSMRRWIFADVGPIVDLERRGTDPPRPPGRDR
jgi:hypothetical protein